MEKDGKDGSLVESMYFHEDYRIDTLIYFQNESATRIKYENYYTYKRGVLYEVICKKNGKPFKGVRYHFEGDKCVKRVHSKIGGSFDFVEGFSFYPDGKLLKKYTNNVSRKQMTSEIYQYGKDNKLQLVQVKRDNVLIERKVYLVSKMEHKVRIINNSKVEIGIEEFKFARGNQLSYYKLDRKGDFKEVKFEFYQNELVKKIFVNNSKSSQSPYYYEIEYAFFE